MNTEQKARAYNNLLKAIDEKRLAVVPVEPDQKQREQGHYANAAVYHNEKPYSLYKCMTQAVDQKEILKGLEDG